MFQEYTFNFNMTPIITVFFLILLFFSMAYIYFKKRIFMLAVVIELFSLIVGVNAFSIKDIPLQPWISIFVMLMNSLFFILISFQTWNYGKGG